MTCERPKHSLVKSELLADNQRLQRKELLRQETERRVGVLNGKVVSDEDMDLFSMAWHVPLQHKGKLYFRRTKCLGGRKRKSLFLHRIIAARILGRELTKEDIVDHIDGNTLNNRRENLRVADAFVNQSNVKHGYKYRGTTRLPSGRWQAIISCLKTRYYLGVFDTRDQAAEAAENKRQEFKPLLMARIKTT